jgi:hypothetical protein
MARMPGATFIGPTPNKTTGGMVEVRGLVLHIQQGTEQGSEAWFKNPAAQASSHFLNPKSGGLRQMVDTADRAWAEAAGNAHWVSVENEGYAGDKLTASQLDNAAHLLVWLHHEYGVPLVRTDDPNGRGLGWHGMGGASWGGHTGCPGDPIKAQRTAIIEAAYHLIVPTRPSVSLAHVVAAARRDPGLPQGGTTYKADVLPVERALAFEGLLEVHFVDGSFGSLTRTGYRGWQQRLGYSGSDADGIPGKASLTKLGARHGFTVTS